MYVGQGYEVFYMFFVCATGVLRRWVKKETGIHSRLPPVRSFRVTCINSLCLCITAAHKHTLVYSVLTTPASVAML